MTAAKTNAATAKAGRSRAIAALLACGLLWSTAGALIEYVDWPPAAIWGVRSAIVAVALLLIRRPSWRGLTTTEVAAGLALAANQGLFILANKWASPANAILIQYSAPAWTAILATFVLRERSSRGTWVAIGVALAGVALFFLDDLSFDHLGGNAVALGAGVALAVHVVLLRKIARAAGDATDPAMRAIILGHVVAALIGVPFALTAPALPLAGWAALLALGLLQQLAPTLLYAWAITRVTAVEGLLFPIIEPIASPLWVWILLAERPGPWALAGGALVVAAVVLHALTARKPDA